MTKRKGMILGMVLVAVLLLIVFFLPDSKPKDLSPAGERVWAYAQEQNIPFRSYPTSLIALLDRNPETEQFVLEYPIYKDKQPEVDLSAYKNCEEVPLFLQWDPQWGYIVYGSDVAGLTGCGPVCLSMVAWYLTEDEAYSPDKMLRFALDNGYYSPGNGSSWTLISEGGVKLGFDVTELPLDENRMLKNLEVGNPIICAMGPGDFTSSGHYIVLTGTQDGLFRVNDPNSRANSEKLWSYAQIQGQIRNIWAIRKLS